MWFVSMIEKKIKNRKTASDGVGKRRAIDA